MTVAGRGRAHYLAAICLWAIAVQAHAAERVALVIGNSAYENTLALPNPRNDATDIARLLREALRFEVSLHLDLDEDAMESALVDFGRKAERADLALVFYAGHGIEFEGRNYLLPVDAPPLTHERQVRRLTRLDDVVAEAAYARVGIILVDACRDNPLANNLRAALPRTRSAAVSRGLGRLEASPSQTLVVYATEAGQVADDGGDGRNSPFTMGLLNHLATPGLEVGLLFRKVRSDVMQATGNRQQPAVYGSLSEEPIYLALGGEAHDGVPPLSRPPVGIDPAEEAWALIRAMPDGQAKRQALEAFLVEYPDHGLAATARIVLGTLAAMGHGEVIRDRLKDGGDGPEMVFLKGGSFLMGSPERGHERFERQHRVQVGDVLIARTEVTVDAFRRFVEASGYRTDAERNAGTWSGCYGWDLSDDEWTWRPGRSWRAPGFDQGPDSPVVCVSWNDAQAYLAWLSAQTGEAYRLPTEAEWEYAARAGTTTARFWGDDPHQACDYANVADQTQGPGGVFQVNQHLCRDGHWYPAPVGSYRPNPWGLSDMLGNVWEWTCSAFEETYGGSETRCESDSDYRPVRGGGWYVEPMLVRAASRIADSPPFRTADTGFRPVRLP